MKSKQIFLLSIFSLIPTFTPLHLLADICGEAVFQIGWFAATQGKKQHINIEGLIGDDFSVKKSSDQNLLFGAGYYLNGPDTSCASFSYGINAFYLAPTTVKGNIKQENLFTNLCYKYSRSNIPIYVAAKALIPCGMEYALVIDLGIGPNITSTKNFKEKSLDGGVTLPDEHIFSGKNLVKFSATAGLGWKMHHVFGNCSLEIDYRFFYLGESELKKVNNQVKNNLRGGNSYANALILSVSI